MSKAIRRSLWVFILLIAFFICIIAVKTKAEPDDSGYSSMQGSAEVYPSIQGIDISDATYAVDPVTKTIDDATASSVSGVPVNDLMFIQEWEVTSDTYPLTVSFYIYGAWNKMLYAFSDSDNGWSRLDKGTGHLPSLTFSENTHVAVYAGPSLLTSFTIEPLEIVEETGGYTTSRWNDDTQQNEEFYYYYPANSNNLKITATYDGETRSGTQSDITSWLYSVTDSMVDFYIEDNQWNEPWKVGKTYTVAATLMDAQTTFDVTIKPFPLEYVRANDITISEGAYIVSTLDQQTNDRYIWYNLDSIVKVTIKYNGEEYSGTLYDIQNIMTELTDSAIRPEITTSQSSASPWTAGHTYQAKVSFKGKESTFNVTIGNSPFASIKAEDTTVIKDVDGYTYYDDATGTSYFRYNYTPAITLTTQSGEEISYNPSPYSGTLTFENEVFPMIIEDDQDDNPWGLGDHQATVYCGGLNITAKVTVVETPVKSLQVDPIIAYEGVDFSWDYYLRTPFTITFKDGTTQRFERRIFQYDGKNYELSIDIPGPTSAWKAGETYSTTGSILGFSSDVTIGVYGIESLEVQEDDGLTLLIHQTDGKTVEATVQNFYYTNGESKLAEGPLRTDKGVFTATVSNYDTCENVQITLGDKTSNAISYSKWMETNKNAMKSWFLGSYRSTSFKGKINKDNIDQILIASQFYYTQSFLDAETSVPVATMKQRMNDMFVITADFDISLSSYYNADTGMIDIPRFGGIGGIFDGVIISTDDEQGYVNFFAYGPEQDMTVLFNEDYKITEYSTPSSLKTATITWKDEDGSVLEVDEDMPYGETPSYDGETPKKAADAQYTYTFAGWTPAVAEVEGDATYTATYSKTVNQYKVTFVDEDGKTVLKAATEYDYGTKAADIAKPADPTKAATAQYTYTFAGWDKAVADVTGDATYKATYTSTVNKYKVTFVDEDGKTVLKAATEYDYGTKAANIAKPADPTKKADAQYTYTFAGWDKAVADVTGDATYKATYSKTVNKYTVTWKNADGTVLKTEKLDYGSKPAYSGQTPTKAETEDASYVFDKWTPEIKEVTGDATYTAVFKEVPVTFPGVAANYTGLAKGSNGNWYYLKNGKKDTSYTGVAKNDAGWWRVENGKVNFDFTGLAKNENGWWYLKDGKVDFNYTGFASNENGWWYVEKGQLKFDKDDVIKGVANNEAGKAGEEGWWLVRGSKVTKETTVAKNANGWWRIEDGKVNFKYTGVAKNEYGWWYLKDGKVDFGYTGFGSNENGWWYVESGQVKFDKDDVIKGVANNEAGKAGEEGWWLVRGSKVTKETTVAKNANGWWRIEDGKVNFKYTGVAKNEYGWWYLKDGKVDFGYTGFGSNENGWWYVESGQVKFNKDDVIKGVANNEAGKAGEEGWWLVRESKVRKETTVAKNSNGWWYIKDGKVDFGYTGLGTNENGTWFIKNGKVDFSFNGKYDGKTIVNGKVQ